ncbi:MAG: hypothetical protein II664_04250 [Oscillospiraceae bacterium]|nr:hypothetical protein [Oscillospiraceae bacterium]
MMMDLREISKKVFIARIIISIIIVIIFMVMGIYFLIRNMTQHHFHEAPEYMLSDLTDAEQAEILDVFDLRIPGNEEKAYVYSYSYGEVNDKLFAYTIEIAGVEDYEGFYLVNPHQKSFNETTSNFRTDRSYYIVYKGSVDTTMKKQQHEKYSALYNKIYERQN